MFKIFNFMVKTDNTELTYGSTLCNNALTTWISIIKPVQILDTYTMNISPIYTEQRV